MKNRGFSPWGIQTLCSRAAFPLAFSLFMAIYWTTCLLSVPALPSDVVMLTREE